MSNRTPSESPSLHHHQPESISRGLKWSMGLHIALFLTVIIKSTVFPGNPVAIPPTLRVDLVGLPDILKKDLSQVPLTPPANESQPNQKLQDALEKAEADAKSIKTPPIKDIEKAAPDEMVLKPKKSADAKEAKPDQQREKRMKNALDRIKALSKITGEPDQPKSNTSGAIVKGNQISKGTSLSGDARASLTASYYDLIRSQLQNNWSLPVWIARQKLSAQAQIFIDSRGHMRSYRMIRPSGNEQFDEAVKRALQDSTPYPTAPPQEISSSLLSNGILVGFPL